MDEERDYELVGEDVGTDPETYDVGEVFVQDDEPTEFGYKPGEIPEKE